MLKAVEIFQHFSTKFYEAQNLSCSASMFLILLPSTKGSSFFETNSFLQWLRNFEILHQNANFGIVFSITVPQSRRKKSLFIINHYRLRISNLLFKMVEVFGPESPDYMKNSVSIRRT